MGIIKSNLLIVIGIAAPISGALLLDIEVWFRVAGFAVGIAIGMITLILKIRELIK